MLAIGDRIVLRIEALARSGAGVGFYDADTRRAVFVPRTVPGDEIVARITTQRKVYYEGELLEITTPSATRVEASCPHFGTCGACDWLHVSYPEQLKEKERLLRHAFAKQKIKLGKITVKSGEPYHYRCKVRFPGDGFSARKSNKIVKVSTCELLHPAFKELLPQKHVKGECWGLDEKSGEITQDEARYALNDASLLTYLPSGFVQSNFAMNKILVDHVVAAIDENSVLELYAGNGNFTIPLAAKTAVLAVEGDPDSHALLVKNLKVNGRKARTRFLDVRDFLNSCDEKFDSLLLDPPRSGVGEEITALAALTKKIIYVSCDAETLAREAAVLYRKGFKIVEITLFDLFPQTRHYETVLLLTRA